MSDLSLKPPENRLYVGGLPVRTSREELYEFFSQFGKVLHCKAKKNAKTGRLLGHVFVTFEDKEVVAKLIHTRIFFKDRLCECKPLLKDELLKESREKDRRKKLLVYHIEQDITNEDFNKAFQGFQGFSHGFILKDPHSNINRGHGYAFFKCEQDVEAFCLQQPVIMLGGNQIKYSKDLIAPPKSCSNKKQKAKKREKFFPPKDLSETLLNGNQTLGDHQTSLGRNNRPYSGFLDSSVAFLKSNSSYNNQDARQHPLTQNSTKSEYFKEKNPNRSPHHFSSREIWTQQNLKNQLNQATNTTLKGPKEQPSPTENVATTSRHHFFAGNSKNSTQQQSPCFDPTVSKKSFQEALNLSQSLNQEPSNYRLNWTKAEPVQLPVFMTSSLVFRYSSALKRPALF